MPIGIFSNACTNQIAVLCSLMACNPLESDSPKSVLRLLTTARTNPWRGTSGDKLGFRPKIAGQRIVRGLSRGPPCDAKDWSVVNSPWSTRPIITVTICTLLVLGFAGRLTWCGGYECRWSD